MPSLFASLRRRMSAAPAPDGAAEPEPAESPETATEAEEVERTVPRGYTPSKKERGLTTPKRPVANVRRPGAVSPSRSRKDLTKEERQALKEERRQRRREVSEGMRRGDERYLTARDRGPERAIARDVVDSRRTIGTYFFAGALLVLLLSGAGMPAEIRLAVNVFWALLALAIIVDCTLLCRKVKRLIRERHPDSTQRMGSIYFYVVMRSVTFRKLRIPLPRKSFGERA